MHLSRPLTAVGVAVATLSVLTLPAVSQAQQPAERPVASKAALNLVFVLDGLRPDSITQAETPNLFRLREQGVDFPQSHAVVPTVTRVNATVLGTGTQPGRNGIVGNSVYLPSVSATRTVDTGRSSQLLRLRDAEGRISLTKTLGERLQEQGKRLVAIGSGSSGSSLLLNPTAPDGTGVMINAGSSDGPRAFPAAVGQEMERRFGPAPVTGTGANKVDYIIKVLNEYVLTDLAPDVVLSWLTEPDAVQHDRGVGSEQAKAGIRNDDRNLGLVMARLRQLGLADRTNIMVVSDHGFSAVDAAINLSNELVAAGLKQSTGSTDVVVANTGSVALHVRDREPAKIEALAEFLLSREDVDNVFTARRRPQDGSYTATRGRGDATALREGWVEGTGSLELIGHASPERGADLVVTFPWSSKANGFGVPGTATTAVGGMSMTGPRSGDASTHGSFSPFDIRNTFFGWGVDWKDGVRSQVPAGNADVAPTLLALEGVGVDGLDGRVLREGLEGGPAPESVRSTTTELVVSTRDGRYRGRVTVSETGRNRYVDQARRLPADRRAAVPAR